MEERNQSQAQIGIDDLIIGLGSEGKISRYYFNVLLNNMNEDQVCEFLNVFIDAIQKDESYINSFGFVSKENNRISIILSEIKLECISDIEKLIRIISSKKNIKIIFHKCTFSNVLINYFIENEIDSDTITFKENNTLLIFSNIILRNTDLSNIELKDFKKMIEIGLLKEEQGYVNCSLSNDILFNSKSSKTLLGVKNGIFKYTNLHKNNNRVRDIISKKIILIDNLKINKLQVNNQLVSAIMKGDIKSRDGGEILVKKGDLSELNLSGLNLRNIQFDNLTNINGTILYKTQLNKEQIRKIIELNRRDLAYVDISSLKIRPKDNINLSNCDLTGANLANTDLERINLTNTNLSLANMYKTNFTSSNITKANFEQAKMTNVKFDSTQLGLIFKNRIKGIRKENPNSICITHFSQQAIQQIDFSGVNMQNFTVGIEFIRAVLRGKLKGRIKGDLSNLDLQGMSLISFKEKDFVGSNFKNTNLKDVKFNDQIIELILTKGLGTIEKGNLSFLNLRHNNIENFDFTNANVYKISIGGEHAKLITENKIKGWNPNNLTNLNLSRANLKYCDLSNADLTGSHLHRVSINKKTIQLIIDGKLKGRKKGDLNNIAVHDVMTPDKFEKIHFHGYIDLTGVYFCKQYINCEFLKLIFENKVIGLNDVEKIILRNQDLGDLDLSIDLIKKYNIKFIGCKFNKKQLLSILKSDISIELYDKYFKLVDLTGIDLNEIDFKSKDIRTDLKNKILSDNTVLSPKQARLISKHKIKRLTSMHDYDNTANPVVNNSEIINSQFNIPNNTSITNSGMFNNNTFQQNNILNNNNNNSLIQMSDVLSKINMEAIEFKEKPLNIDWSNNNTFQQNNTLNNNTLNPTINNIETINFQFNIPNNIPIVNNSMFNNNLIQQNNTLNNNNNNNNDSLRQLSDMLDEIDMEITELKEKPSDTPFKK